MFHNDVGAYVHCEAALSGQDSVGQAATGNVTALNGISVDMTGLARNFKSVKVAVPVFTHLDTGRTFKAKVDLQHRSATTTGAGSTWANLGTTGRTLTRTNATTTTGVETNEVIQVCFENEGQFRMAKKFVRIVVSPANTSPVAFIDSTATGGSTYRIGGGVLVLGTPDALPASG